MNKNILSEVSRMKEIMGLINEQNKNQQQTTGMVGKSDEEAKEKGVIVPSDCPDSGCFFYSDGGNSENGGLYKKSRAGVIFFANNPTDISTHLKSSEALGVRHNGQFGTSMDPSQSRDLINSVINYAASGKVTDNFRKYFPEIQNKEDALASLIIPWKPNAKKVIYGLPLFSYDKNTVYVKYNGEESRPPSVTQVTNPKVSDDENSEG